MPLKNGHSSLNKPFLPCWFFARGSIVSGFSSAQRSHIRDNARFQKWRERKKGACSFENVPNGITDDIEDILCGNSNAHLFAMSCDVIEQLKDRWETHYDFMDDYVYQAFETCAHTHHSDARRSFFLGEKPFRARPASNDPKRAVERKRKTINAIESLDSFSATARRPSTTIARRNRR